MPVTNDDFIESARKMFHGGREIDFRNAVSRAYYAAYHEAKKIADQHANGVPHSKAGVHEKIIQKLKNHAGGNNEPIIRQIGDMLKHCKSQRIKADYKLSTNVNQTNSSICIQYCKNLIDLCRKNFS